MFKYNVVVFFVNRVGVEITILHTKTPYCDRKARFGGFTPLVSGREGGPHLRLQRRNPPQHKATCDSPRLLVAPSSSVLFSLFFKWRGQHFNSHWICQAISCKCPQLEEHFRNGLGPRGSELLIGRRGSSAVKSAAR